MTWGKFFSSLVKIISKFILVVVSVIVTLLTLELAIRLSQWTPNTNQINDWEFAYDSKSKFYTTNKRQIYKILQNVYLNTNYGSDRYGFRFNPSHENKNRDTYKKIVVVGDSFTYGQGLGYEETFPYLMEQQLTSKGYNVWVDNAGIPGYGLDQEFIYLKDFIIPKTKPDIVIWALNHNDIGDSNDACLFKKIGTKYYQLSGALNSIYFKTNYFPLIPKPIKSSYLFSFLDSKIPFRYTLGCTRKALYTKKFANKLKYFFDEFKILAKRYNFEPVIAIVINQHFFVKDGGYPDWDTRVLNQQGLTDLYISVAQQADIPILDLNNQIVYFFDTESQVLGVSAENEQNIDNLFIEEQKFDIGWRHTNERGNLFMSQLVSDTLETWFLDN